MKRFLALWLTLILFSWYPVNAGRLLVRTSSQRFELTTAIVTAYPFSVAAWVYPVSTGINQGVFSIDTDGTADHRHAMTITSANLLNVNTRTTGAGTAASTSTVSANTWVHLGGVYASATSRLAYFNGVQEGSNAVSLTPAGMNRTRIGAYFTTSLQHFDGRIADVCIWAEALTTAEYAAMTAGVPCTRIRPQALVGCPKLWGVHDPEIDVCAARPWPLVGSPAAAPHAPVGLFTRP